MAPTVEPFRVLGHHPRTARGEAEREHEGDPHRAPS
jgi:hypothetical protein